jgi:class 3 adenylate cyclase
MGRGTSSDLLACTACGAELPTTARFCPECGVPALAGPERETRRTVTLLFTDVTGSTSMGEQLDPEAYRDVMGRYFAVARAAVERHGGTVEKFVGDAVLAVFGIPDVHEDDALRAVRAARELNDAVAALSERLGAELDVRLAIRTGVNTGAVVTGSARAGGSFATGDAVNTAARLEQAAAPGEILLGATTYALVRDAVEVEVAEPVLAKGKLDPVPAYRLHGVLDVMHGHRRRGDVALVGRIQESRALDDALERTMTSGHSHLVTVLGPPGIGKSRLVTEFLTRVGDRAGVAHGRCVSYGQGIAYWPLVQALRHALHLSGTESDETTRHALELALGEVPDRDQVVDVLLPLLGKTGMPSGNEQTVWSVRRLLEELASRRLLVLSIDDLHWAEPTLLQLLERVRDEVSDLPLLIVCQARPELLEQHPGWGSGAVNVMTVGLDPLTPGEIEASVAGLLGGTAPNGLARAVTDWSGGNPLFVEEIVAHLVEAGILEQEDDGQWRIAGELGRAQLPPTVSALLAARLDRLPVTERDLLSRVSVIGLEFTTADAELLAETPSGPGVGALLLALTRRDLVRRLRPREGDGWAFKHILVRDAAYDGVSKAVRAELHERFADGLATGDSADGGGEHAGFVAHHLEQAARYRRELAARGPEVDALVDRAVQALVLAADEARDGDRYADAISYLNRAMGLGPGPSSVRRRILARLAVYHVEEFQFDELEGTLGAYEASLDDTAEELDRAFLRTMQGAYELDSGRDIDPARVSEHANELVSLGRAAADPQAVVRGLRVASLCSAVLGLWRDAAAECDEIIRIGSPAEARDALGMRAAALFVGDGPLREFTEFWRHQVVPTLSRARQEEATMFAAAVDAAAGGAADARKLMDATEARRHELSESGEIGDGPTGWYVDVYAMSRDLDGAIAYSERLIGFMRGSGALGTASTYILLQALLRLERGDPPGDVLPLVEQAASHTSPHDASSVSLQAACRAILAARSGDHDAAYGLTEEALRVTDRTQAAWEQADLRRWLSEVPRAAGDIDLERRMLRESQRLYDRKEIRSYDTEISRRLDELGRAGT